MTLYLVANGGTRVELSSSNPGMEAVQIETTHAVPIARVIADCIAAKTQANLRPDYVRSLKVYLQSFAKWRENTPIASFNLETLEAWFNGRKETPATRRGNIGRLSALFSYACRRGFIRDNPVKRLERVRVDPKPPRILTPMEAHTILLFMNSHGRRRWRLPQIILGMFCGIRPAELTRIHWSDVDMAKGLVRVDASASKVRHRRIVPIAPNALEWLRLCKTHTAPLGAVRWKWIEDLERGTGIKWEPDLLRHTAASYLLARDEDCGKVSRWLGNSPDVLLGHYTELVSAEDCLAFWQIRP